MSRSPSRSRPPHRLHLFPVLLVLSLAANAVLLWRLTRPPAPPAPPPEPAGELALYAALGSNMAENNRIADLQWNEAQFNAFLHGMRASYEGRGYPLDEDARALRQAMSARVQAMLDAEQPDPTEGYFRMLREQENVLRTDSGLHYRVTHEGPGASPRPEDTIVVSYAARTPDGRVLATLSGERLRVRVTDLLPGLAEGVQLLKAGGKGLVYVPAHLSFGEGKWPEEIQPGMPIGFFVELHEVIPADRGDVSESGQP